MMWCVSTSQLKHTPPQAVSFSETLLSSLAPDNGLYIPIIEPALLTPTLNTHDSNSSFRELAADVSLALLHDDLPHPDTIARDAFTFAPVLRQVDENIAIMELFHGPTCAFKDFGASFLAHSLEALLDKTDRRTVILTATSGDTGSAVGQAFHRRNNIDVAILYPSKRISPLQEQQLTTIGDNVQAFEVNGSFDDCQKMVKNAFQNRDLNSKLSLTSANSINLGRLIPQSFYYMFAYTTFRDQLYRDKRQLLFCVPSGNFGNLTAGLLAREWGMPVDRFIAATNANNIVPNYLNSGNFMPRPSIATYSNAMDVGDPSNFARMRHLYSTPEQLSKILFGTSVSDEETATTMNNWHKERSILLDPHTAVGAAAVDQYFRLFDRKNILAVILGTAHPGKFSEVVRQATGVEPMIPTRLAEAQNKTKQSIVIDNNADHLARILIQRFF